MIAIWFTERIVDDKGLQYLFHRAIVRGIPLHQCQAGFLEFSRTILRENSRSNLALKARVAFHLRNPYRRICAIKGVIVISVVLEGLSKRRCAIETRHTVA